VNINTNELDVRKVLGMADAEFSQTMRRLLAVDAAEADRATMRRLHGYVHADPRREAQFAAKMARLDQVARRDLLTPERIEALLPSVLAELGEEVADQQQDSAMEVLWHTGSQWVITQLGALRETLQRGVELVSRAVQEWQASDDLLALVDYSAAQTTRSRRGASVPGGEGEPQRDVEIPIVGHDLPKGVVTTSLRLCAGPLRSEQVEKRRMLRGRFELSGEDATAFVGQGFGVLLVSENPAVAFAVILQRDGERMVGDLDVPLPSDVTELLDRKKFTARLWRSMRNREQGER